MNLLKNATSFQHYKIPTMSSYRMSLYKVIGYIPYAVHYILVTYLFYHWKFVPLNSLTCLTVLPLFK